MRVKSDDDVRLTLQLESSATLGSNAVRPQISSSFSCFICTKNYVLSRADTVYVTALSKDEASLNFDFDIGFDIIGSIFGNLSLKGDVELTP